MPSIDTAAAAASGFQSHSKNLDNYNQCNGRVSSVQWNGTRNNNNGINNNVSNGTTTWGSSNSSHYSQPMNRNRVYYGNGGPITTVLPPPPKHPCLINLDPFGASFFQYPLMPGVTMLGTGRGCPKPPDLVLHGTGVEPQHCFIERNPIDDEVILHPICERTTVDDVPISGPTPLVPGNLVTIGGSHTFRFDGPTTTMTTTNGQQGATAGPPTITKLSPEEHEDTGILQRLQIKQQKMRQQQQLQSAQQKMKSEQEESPYAIINPGAGNPLGSAGDVNKNSLHGIKIMDPRLTLEQTFFNPAESGAQEQKNDLRRGGGGGGVYDKTSDRTFINSVSNGNNNGTSYNNGQSNKFGGDSFVYHHIPVSRSEFESRRMFFEGVDSSTRSAVAGANKNFNGQYNANDGYSSSQQQEQYNGARNLNSSGISSGYNVTKSELSKCCDRQDSGRSYYYCSTPVRDGSISSPLLSFSSCSSGSSRPGTSLNMDTSTSSRHYNSNNNEIPLVDSLTCRTHTSPHGQYLRDEAIACETLLELKRKQAYEARLAADMTQRSEKLRLEEILAMCAEYEEQIAREIREKTPLSNISNNSVHQDQSGLTSNTNNSCNNNNNSVSNRSPRPAIVSSPDKPAEITTPKSPTLYGYSRIKTNGSLPRDKKSTISESSRCHSSNNSTAVADDEIASIFTFSPTIAIPNDVFLPSSSSTSIPTPCVNSTYHQQRKPDELDRSFVPPKSGFRSNIKSPYENVNGNQEETTTTPVTNPPQSPRTRIRTTLGKVPNDVIYSSIRRPIITTVVDSKENKTLSSSSSSQPPTPPPPSSSSSLTSTEVTKSPTEKPRGKSPTKSKLTVTFSSSVTDIHEESEREERSNSNDRRPDVLPPAITVKQEVKLPVIATQVQVHAEGDKVDMKAPKENNVNTPENVPSVPPLQSQSSSKADSNNYQTSVSSSSPDSSKSESSRVYPVVITESRVEVLKKNISEIERQEMEAIREMEIEKALLLGEENSLESQIAAHTKERKELKAKLENMDVSNRQWRAESLEHIAKLKVKLNSSEQELERLEKIQDNFEGNTDEETSLLEQLKQQHELVEIDRKAFEDAEFYHMEEEINREGQRDELSKIVSELDRKVLAGRAELEQLQSQNRISFTSSAKEVQKLEERRQELIQELRQLRESIKLDENLLQIPDPTESISDNEDVRNTELEDKLRSLSLFNASTDDAIRIERIKSRSPIDPMMRTIGAKTCETLREIERNRECLLNEQGVQMLEQERQRVRELQKRVQDAVREEWEASRKSRNNQCHSLNSVGSEESTQTISDTPTDSGSGDDTTDTSGAPSVSTTDMSLNTMSGGVSTEKFEQMRQKQRDMSDGYEETMMTRPLSDGSAYDDGSTIVTMREKHRVQSRPLTRYLPVRGDEERFDLRAFIESSGHQLELCPHIIVTATAARGFLSKLGSRFNNWVKRWFVFDRETRTFSYYIDKGEKKPRGGIHFQAIEEVYVDHLQSVKSPHPKLTFCVKTSSRVFHLMAPSPEAMRMWVDIIFTGAEGYQEFLNGTTS